MQCKTFGAVNSSCSELDNGHAFQSTVVYPANSLPQLKKHLNSTSCTPKTIQNGSEAIQVLNRGFDLCIQRAQVTIVGLWLDLNRKYAGSQDGIPRRRHRDVILGSDYQIPPRSWLKHAEENQEWSNKRSAHILFPPVLQKPGVSINNQT